MNQFIFGRGKDRGVFARLWFVWRGDHEVEWSRLPEIRPDSRGPSVLFIGGKMSVNTFTTTSHQDHSDRAGYSRFF